MISSGRLAQNTKGSCFYKFFFKKEKKNISYVKHGQIWLNDFVDDHHFWLH